MYDIPPNAEFSSLLPSHGGQPNVPLDVTIVRSNAVEAPVAAKPYEAMIVASDDRGGAEREGSEAEPEQEITEESAVERPVEEPAIVAGEAGGGDGPADPPNDPPGEAAASPDDPRARILAVLAESIAMVHRSEELLGPSESPFYVVGEDGVTRPRDERTRETLQPGEIPPSLLADENIRRGVEFLQQHGSEIDLRVLLVGNGERDALASSGVDLRAEAEAVRDAGGSLYLDGIASQEMAALLRTVYQRAIQAEGFDADVLRQQLLIAVATHPNLTHDLAIAEQLIGTGATVRQVDFITDGPGADRVLAAQYRLLAAQEGRTGDVSALMQAKRLQASFIHHHGAYLMAKVGGDLAAQHATTGTFPAHNTLVVGRTNENIGQDFQRLGVAVSMVGNREQNPAKRHLLQAVARGEIHPDDYIRFVDI